MPDTRATDHHATRPRLLAAAATAAILALATASFAQTKVNPGFNLFSVQQDIEIGQQSAREAERQLQILGDGSIEDYVDDLVERLGDAAPGHKFPYSGKVVNAREINAFALPGGPLYVNRGLVEAARTEGELAGVIAHEVAHIALRHGTHNASKAYATQAGIGVLGGILTRGKTRTTADIINVVGGLGLNAVFLKYGRDAETQADIVGAQMLASGRLRPHGDGALLRAAAPAAPEGPGEAGAVLQQPPRPRRPGRPRAAGGEAHQRPRHQPRERRVPAGAGRAQGHARGPGHARDRRPAGAADPIPHRADRPHADVRVDPPSSRFVRFRQREGFFEIEHPDNWRAYEAQDGFGVTIVPEGGVVDAGNGSEAIVYGVIVNHYDPFENTTASRITLDDAMTDLLNHIREGNPHLRASGTPRRETVDGQSARSAVLSGTSPVTGHGGARDRVRPPDGRRAHPVFAVRGPRPRLRDLQPDVHADEGQPARERRRGACRERGLDGWGAQP